MRFRNSAAAAAVCGAALMPRVVLAQSSQLPDAPGKAAVTKICATCHEIESVISSRRTKIGWQQSVDDMIGRGAEGSDAEMTAVVEYLATYFGKVNVNTASAAEIEKTVGLPAKEAEAIAVYRERNGKIKDFEELKRVPGVRAEALQAKRGLIAFSL
jgi:competence protein ComEA